MESQERIEWFAKRAQLSLSLSVDQKKMLLHDTHYRQIINNFFTIPDKTLLRVSIKNKLSNLQNHWNDEIYLSNNIPTRIDGKTLFLIKTNDLANANLDNIDSSRSISIHDNATIIELLHKIIVNIQLSIADFEDKITVVSPSMESLEQLAYSDQGSEFASSIMENIVLHWLKVIKKLLIKTDVFEYAKEKNKTADILDEIHVWQMYHESLLTIKNQLDTVSSHEIIDKLSESKSACISHLNRYLIEIERKIVDKRQMCEDNYEFRRRIEIFACYEEII
ncbi:hypothetical protein A3Q56_01268 [Intoshia linei]|uniref:Dynein heavy chain tail domain-containing protein n=1 Tax=Intoshia linei TaxID=1819745 RepID=A0A177BC24_9BILA|nr:hypothetical protein A3Q56_01268 [Intoshia linei]